MEEYTILCTPEQTKKALKLGAPIEKLSLRIFINEERYKNPTAEQMIGWLEEQDIEDIEIGNYVTTGSWHYAVFMKGKHSHFAEDKFASRKQATLAAIDAALEYLSNKKI